MRDERTIKWLGIRMRHPTRKAIDKFNKLLNLNEKPFMQDWEIECADPNRVEEFLNCYRSFAHTADERFTLMALILGSFEEYHGLEISTEGTWQQIKEILSLEFGLHKDHIEYYACRESEGEDEWFPITLLIRTVMPTGKHA